MPPLPLISSSARSKPRFHCSPYCASCPVSGPLTPITTGSPDTPAASAPPVDKPHAAASAATVPSTRRHAPRASFPETFMRPQLQSVEKSEGM